MIESSQIERMSVAERLQVMDQLWDSLTRNGDEIPSPNWQFYESCATGVGDYFLDSILSDLDSLILFAGVRLLSLNQPCDVPNFR
jgi:hypothetical protein